MPPSAGSYSSQGYYPPPGNSPTLGDEKATSSLVLAILGLIFCPFLAIVAFVQTSPLKRRSKQTGQPLNGSVNAAWVVSIIGLCLLTIYTLWFLFIVAVGVGGISSVDESGDSETTTQSEDKNNSTSKPGRVGQVLTNAGTKYRVTKAKTAKTIGDPETFGEKADGLFVIVNLELTNTKDETKTFLDSNAKLITSDGKIYETSDKAISLGDDSLTLKDIQPDLTTRGKLAFEIPPSKVAGSVLVIEDLWGDGEIKVDLAL